MVNHTLHFYGISWGQFECAFGLHTHLQWSASAYKSVLYVSQTTLVQLCWCNVYRRFDWPQLFRKFRLIRVQAEELVLTSCVVPAPSTKILCSRRVEKVESKKSKQKVSIFFSDLLIDRWPVWLSEENIAAFYVDFFASIFIHIRQNWYLVSRAHLRRSIRRDCKSSGNGIPSTIQNQLLKKTRDDLKSWNQ